MKILRTANLGSSFTVYSNSNIRVYSNQNNFKNDLYERVVFLNFSLTFRSTAGVKVAQATS